jgi:hypothetical protein
MFVAVARIVLSIPGARSLKDRRQVVRSFRDRARARLSVSIAEVGDIERYQVATLGVAVVGRDSAHCAELLSQVTRMARGLREALVADIATEVIPFGGGGSGVRGGIERIFDEIADTESDDEEES